MLAEEAHEVRAGDASLELQPLATLFEQPHVLAAARPDRLNEAPALRELICQRRWHGREGSRDDDDIELRLNWKPQPAVSDQQLRIFQSPTW